MGARVERWVVAYDSVSGSPIIPNALNITNEDVDGYIRDNPFPSDVSYTPDDLKGDLSNEGIWVFPEKIKDETRYYLQDLIDKAEGYASREPKPKAEDVTMQSVADITMQAEDDGPKYKTHYVVMSGLLGYMPDNVEAHHSAKDAVESMTSMFDLSKRKAAELLANLGLELKPSSGAEYISIDECSCNSPWEHSEGDEEDSWNDWVVKEPTTDVTMHAGKDPYLAIQVPKRTHKMRVSPTKAIGVGYAYLTPAGIRVAYFDEASENQKGMAFKSWQHLRIDPYVTLALPDVKMQLQAKYEYDGVIFDLLDDNVTAEDANQVIETVGLTWDELGFTPPDSEPDITMQSASALNKTAKYAVAALVLAVLGVALLKFIYMNR